jgi:hypothetical protein
LFPLLKKILQDFVSDTGWNPWRVWRYFHRRLPQKAASWGADIKRARMKRRHRSKEDTTSLKDRLVEQGRRFRERAKSLPPGIEREELLRKARQAETASQISNFLSVPK